MTNRRRIYYTDKQKSEIWDHWQRGELMNSIRREAKVRRSNLHLRCVVEGWCLAIARC